MQDQRSKFIRVGLAMKILAKVRMVSLVNTMLTHQRVELNVVEISACSCFCPTWKPTFGAMVAKMSWTTSWVLVHLLPWMQCKKWIPIRYMHIVYAIVGWGSLSHVWNVAEKTREDNQKDRKSSQTINQLPTPRPKHDKIQAQWAFNILSKYI
jgi:hypothetical protein